MLMYHVGPESRSALISRLSVSYCYHRPEGLLDVVVFYPEAGHIPL
jgi:hypothetical protein